MVFECPAHLFARAESGCVSPRKEALADGGRLVIQDAFLHDREGLFPEEATLFAVSMLLFTEGEYLHGGRNERLAEGRRIRFGQAGQDEEGEGGLEGGILEAAVLRGRSKGTAPEHDQQQIRAPAECTEDDLET